MTEIDEFSQPLRLMQSPEEEMATFWHLYETGKNSDPLEFATEAIARETAMSMLQAELRESSRWEPSSSRPGGYDLMMRVYGGKKKYTCVATIAPFTA